MASDKSDSPKAAKEWRWDGQDTLTGYPYMVFLLRNMGLLPDKLLRSTTDFVSFCILDANSGQNQPRDLAKWIRHYFIHQKPAWDLKAGQPPSTSGTTPLQGWQSYCCCRCLQGFASFPPGLVRLSCFSYSIMNDRASTRALRFKKVWPPSFLICSCDKVTSFVPHGWSAISITLENLRHTADTWKHLWDIMKTTPETLNTSVDLGSTLS